MLGTSQTDIVCMKLKALLVFGHVNKYYMYLWYELTTAMIHRSGGRSPIAVYLFIGSQIMDLGKSLKRQN